MTPGRFLFFCMCAGVAPAALTVPAQAEVVKVTIDKLVFSPQAVEAHVGDTIEWTNNDILAHTATVRGGFDVMIPSKGSARQVVQQAGTFAYYCRFHPNMKGSLAVTAKP